MTAVREAFALPLIFLTAVLLGSLRLAAPVQIVAPSLFALILASLVVAALVQSGTLAADRLMHAGRTALENLNGAIVLATAFAATAQVLTMVTPISGVPAIAFGLFLLVGIVLMLTASLDRTRLLRVLAVLLGSAFVLKFVVLAAISTPAEGRVARALQLLFEGVTLGTVSQAEVGAATGYLAFAALVLYLIGVWMLPPAGWTIVRAMAPGVSSAGRIEQARSVDAVIDLRDRPDPN